ncbi:sodium/solute symporter [uncultured Polaribacter sp.]|uniref:sodium:solute symporter family transporter n=1 Tax=uncultured Polaribacter sp. TaxID=174711 RepID=UPI00260FC28A|nr:sodium/solute symporter [uncultured Polaribacter sp.]
MPFYLKCKPLKGFFLSILLCVALFSCETPEKQAVPELDVATSILPRLPSAPHTDKSVGYAGMMGGIDNGVIIAAGGANFPYTVPWQGGKKKWYRSIFIFEKGTWRISNTELPIPLAYGASVQTQEGILVIGGNNSVETSDRVFLLNYNPISQEVDLEDFPSLPQPMAHMSAMVEDNKVYVIGGTDGNISYNTVYVMDLKLKQDWKRLPDFPGLPRSFHSTAIQETSFGRKLFVFGGRNQANGQISQLHNTYISYDLVNKEWNAPKPILVDNSKRVIMGAATEAKGSMNILLYGGDDGKLFSALEKLNQNIYNESNDSIKIKLIQKKNKILSEHSGFENDLISFNTITEKFTSYHAIVDTIPVTALSFQENDFFYIISGEIAPGVRTPTSKKIFIEQLKNSFGWLNYSVLTLYLLVTLLIGLYFSKKQHSTKDYFTGSGRVPWWAAGISVFGTLLSALTFMAVPAKSFLTDWSYFTINMTAILIVPVITFLFIPYFNRIKITTAYEFLEYRFNYLARFIGSLSFILFQIGRIGVVLLLPSLAISIVTGIPVEICVLIMGVLCIIYTTFGGIEAVIWTDVLQVVVLLGGSILALFWLFNQTEISIPEAYQIAVDNNKVNIANMDLNFTKSTFWVVLLGGLASALITQGTDQTVVQRYLTSNTVKDAQKTSYINAALTLPATIIFFSLGTLLFIFYSSFPERLIPNVSNNDSIFPWYIVNELPNGVSGLLIAAVFSAAMSSISSSLNSVSTAFCNDFYKHFKPKTSDIQLLKTARVTTVVIGVLGILLALWMSVSDIKSLWDQFLLFIGLLTAGLGGMFLLGIVTKKANALGTLLGVLLSTLFLIYISIYTNIHILLYSFIGLMSCFISGYVFSILFNRKTSSNYR